MDLLPSSDGSRISNSSFRSVLCGNGPGVAPMGAGAEISTLCRAGHRPKSDRRLVRIVDDDRRGRGQEGDRNPQRSEAVGGQRPPRGFRDPRGAENASTRAFPRPRLGSVGASRSTKAGACAYLAVHAVERPLDN